MNKLVFLSLCWLLISNTVKAQPEMMQFRAAVGSPASHFSQALLTEAYQRLGIEVEFIDVPFARSLVESNRGYLAGELARVLKVTEQYPNLLAVPYILFDTEVTLYINAERCENCKLEHVASLVYVRGSLIVEETLKKLPASRQVIGVGTLHAAKTMFIEGKVDGVVFAAYAFDTPLPFPIHKIQLDLLPDYHLLHKKHQHLIPSLRQTLLQLDQEGITDSLRQHYGVVAPKKQLSLADSPFAEYQNQ